MYWNCQRKRFTCIWSLKVIFWLRCNRVSVSQGTCGTLYGASKWTWEKDAHITSHTPILCLSLILHTTIIQTEDVWRPKSHFLGIFTIISLFPLFRHIPFLPHPTEQSKQALHPHMCISLEHFSIYLNLS